MQFSREPLPKQIKPCPIEQAVFEIRFESNLPSEVIHGLLYNQVRNEFPHIQALPILDVPAFVRAGDESMKFAPHYSIFNDKFSIQIGPQALSIVCAGEYVGWDKFAPQISYLLGHVVSMGLISRPIRTGLRYINVIEKEDIFTKLDTELKLAGNTLIGHKNTVASEFSYSGFTCILQMTNLMLTPEGQKTSVVDIDVIKIDPVLSQLIDIAELAHEVEKKIFFSLLTDEYLATLNPEY